MTRSKKRTTPTPTGERAGRKTITARSPEDLLAVVPLVLGFHPRESLVMLTFAPMGEPFHARVDLPPPERFTEVPFAVAPLLRAARANKVWTVAFVVYTTDAALAESTRACLAGVFGRIFTVVDTLWSTGTHWAHLAPGTEPELRSFDPSAHPFAAEAVLEGTVTHPDRASLARTVAADPGRVAAVDAALGAARRRGADSSQRGAEARWAQDLVRDRVRGGADTGPLPAADLARLAVAVGARDVRDAVVMAMSRERAAAHVDLWGEVVRGCPDDVLTEPAALLAFAAWLAGHGALAWCAVDRCLGVCPDHALAGLVARALEDALPPTVWEPGRGGESTPA